MNSKLWAGGAVRLLPADPTPPFKHFLPMYGSTPTCDIPRVKQHSFTVLQQGWPSLVDESQALLSGRANEPRSLRVPCAGWRCKWCKIVGGAGRSLLARTSLNLLPTEVP